MEDGRIPKDILYVELALGRRTTGHPHLRYKDVCIRDMKALDIDTMSWDAAETQQEINKIKNKNIRMYHPWSSLTDGGLYETGPPSMHFYGVPPVLSLVRLRSFRRPAKFVGEDAYMITGKKFSKIM